MDKTKLLSARLSEQDVEVEGGTVRIRALTRAEALSVRGKKMTEDEAERVVLALAMVEPKLTEDEVRQWQEASPAGEIQTVSNAVLRLSGMEKHAAKAQQKSGLPDAG